ncbi:MAG: putative peptide modification system cyclase [Stenotrophomonas sp.]|uniref:putative peptide modification system cyclase n=1 Tax=Stenotrophomonas sp. TaxID=69392 RepID=UPI003D6C8FA6
MDTETENLQSNRQFKTLILTDLCDSVMLVERIGDTAAADLFRRLDAQVLRLLRRWNGRLIDRSDGMFLLFDAPVDGLGFALDYVDELDALGKAMKLPLQARVGVHVGYVLSWENSEEAVAAGAKALEVEGLAKPMAARLMALARPGQILMSSAAESMMRSAQRELDDRGTSLQWKSHGRWRFKGLPTGHEVFEVGRKGRAPLRMPPRSAKASRELPLWRRPAALMAEVAVVVALLVTGWVLVRPEPAIAFAERDWVVVGDLKNLTGNALLDDPLAQAFRISLEQSRYVNVLSDMVARATVSRTRRDPEKTPMGRALASEVALRNGARLVLLPSVSEVGGKVRISVEVIDPNTQSTIRSESVDGRGVESVLASVDGLTSKLRSALGESANAVRSGSDPLPIVTTSNLQALRAYAFGLRRAREGEWRASLQMYSEAVRLDPEFALAYLGVARAHAALSERPKALPWLDKAIALRARLPDRERLYLDAWEAELKVPTQALEKWQVMAGLYPDDFAGQANAAWHLYVANRFDDALPYAMAADVPQDPLRNYAADYVARILLAKGLPEQSLKHLETIGGPSRPGHVRRVAAALAVMRRFGEAEAALDSAEPINSPSTDLVPNIERVAIALDQARPQEAAVLSGRVVEASSTSDAFIHQQFRVIGAMVDLVQETGNRREHRRRLASDLVAEVTSSKWDPLNRSDLGTMLLVNANLALREGDPTLAVEALARVQQFPAESRYSVLTVFERITRAGLLGNQGKLDEAIALLPARTDDFYQSRVMLYGLLSKAGRHSEAEAQARWLVSQRGLAYMEANASQTVQPLNVVDSKMAQLWLAESLLAQGKADSARSELTVFLVQWPLTQLPSQLRSRVERILSASKQKTTL